MNENKNKDNKLLYYFGLFLFVILTVMIAVFWCKTLITSIEKNSKEQEILSECEKYDITMYRDSIDYQSSYKELSKTVSSGTTYVFIGKPNCPYCRLYFPLILEYASAYEIDIVYFNPEPYKEKYYTIDDDTQAIKVNKKNDYAKLANLLFQYDTNVSLEGSDKNFVKLKKVENDDTLPWIYVPRLIKFEDGIPVKSCFAINIDEETNMSNFTPSNAVRSKLFDELKENLS